MELTTFLGALGIAATIGAGLYAVRRESERRVEKLAAQIEKHTLERLEALEARCELMMAVKILEAARK